MQAIRPGERVQAIRIADGEWAKDNVIEQGKHRRVQAQTERDGSNDRNHKQRTAAESP